MVSNPASTLQRPIYTVCSSSTTMTEARGLFLKTPEKLPSTGVTKVTFKVFLKQLTAFLEQDTGYYMFLKEGCYSTWSAKQVGKRITAIAVRDKED